MSFSAMLSNHPLWGLLTLAVLVWYSTITIHIAIRGASDIKQMLRKLNNDQDMTDADSQDDVGKS